MPPFIWTSEPTRLIQSFEIRHKNPLASALVAWANGNSHELDLADFYPKQYKKNKKAVLLREQLPELALQWVDVVCADAEYKKIKGARDSLVHSRLNRHFTFSLSTGHPPHRLKLELETIKLEVRDVVEVARDVATRHVSSFLDLLPRV